MDKEKFERFVEDLNALTAKHNIFIDCENTSSDDWPYMYYVGDDPRPNYALIKHGINYQLSNNYEYED